MSLKEQLDANIPREVISTRTQGGKALSYLEGWYVIDRLNQVLGTENWQWMVEELIPVAGDKQSYIVRGSITANIEGKQVYKSGLGYGSDKGNFNPGEMAIKEAETDALKRAAMKLGRSLGLALYDKTQEFVDDEASNGMDKVAAKETKTVPSVGSESNSESSRRGQSKRNGTSDSGVIKAQIKNAFAVLQAQKKITKEDFISKYLCGNKVDDLTEFQANATRTMLKQDFPELGL